MGATDESSPAKMDIDIIPVMEIGKDAAMRGRIGGAEILHGLIGKHHPPAESVVRSIAFVYLDARRGQGLAQQDGGIESCGTAAQTDDSLHELRSPPAHRYHGLAGHVILLDT